MTAPEHRPDDRSDADPDEPDTAEPDTDEPDLKAIGDSHMPEDLRDDVREHAEAERDQVLERAETEPTEAAAERASAADEGSDGEPQTRAED